MILQASQRDPSPQRGFVLVIVLWTLALLALLSAQLMGTARQRMSTAQLFDANARLEAAADGAVFEAVLGVLRNGGSVAAPVFVLTVGGVAVDVRVTSESTKINPNTTTMEALQPVLVAAGLDATKAAGLTQAIIEWRSRPPAGRLAQLRQEQYRGAGRPYLPAYRPFNSLDELGLVLGMTPDILARIRPVLSVVREEGRTAPGSSKDGGSVLDEPGGEGHVTYVPPANAVYQIDTSASLPDGTVFRRRAAVRVKMVPEPGEQPYEVLGWETPDG